MIYFSSNRIGSKSIEAETCCNDIYEAINKSTDAAAENSFALKQDTVTATDKAAPQESVTVDYANQIPERNASFAPSTNLSVMIWLNLPLIMATFSSPFSLNLPSIIFIKYSKFF